MANVPKITARGRGLRRPVTSWLGDGAGGLTVRVDDARDDEFWMEVDIPSAVIGRGAASIPGVDRDAVGWLQTMIVTYRELYAAHAEADDEDPTATLEMIHAVERLWKTLDGHLGGPEPHGCEGETEAVAAANDGEIIPF